VDDWAKRKGRRYGTIVVDLEQHRVVDLLPDRSAETLAAGLAAHPGIALASRDRAGAYADGIRRGSPGSVQVADRFHLLKNLVETVERVLDRHRVALKAAAAAVRPPPGSGGS
jgi:transposase